ncbi:unnamed protein product [Mytilus edulis]|uniref:B box-type domain-containing protein n=1 Tax=Mytilus edulis TaxID=6550 RepID=A0A8S3TGR1_MYTED|nr:unnamed protein product [Mytilus edulis]
MMASSVPSCGVCEFQNVFKAASIWCSDCDEGLCIDCSKHHGISKATRKHQLESDVDENCQFIDSLTESNVLNRVEIKFNINTSLTDIANSVLEFGKVFIDISNSSVNIVKKKQQQAQLIVPKVSSIVPIDNIQVKLEQTIHTESSYVRGCCILPDGRFVFAYPVLNKVTVVKQDGTVDFVLNVTAAFGIAYNDKDNTLAISSWWRLQGKQITIIDLKGRRVKKTFSPGGQTDGIAVTNNTLLYHIENKAIRAMDLTDESTRDITTENMDTEINITISGHKLYYSSYKYHTVICCDMQGTKQWTFKNENVLKNPLGISADNDGNVYVVGFESDNVVVISPDGQTHRELLTERDGLYYPWSINFRKESNQLLVTNNSKKAYLYNVSSN